MQCTFPNEPLIQRREVGTYYMHSRANKGYVNILDFMNYANT